MSRLARCLIAALLVGLAPASASADPVDVLGASDPGSPGFNASAVGLDGIAYLGSWGGPAECPALGVRVIDVHDPTNPTLLATAAMYLRTTAEHLAAVHFATPALPGKGLF